MQDKPNKRVDYLSTEERLGIPQIPRLYPDIKKCIGKELEALYLKLFLKKEKKKLLSKYKADRPRQTLAPLLNVGTIYNILLLSQTTYNKCIKK